MLVKIAFAALAGVLIAAFAGVARPEQARSASEPGRTITVSGRGTVTAVPDRAHFSFGVDSRGQGAAETLAANGTAVAKLISALKAAGVDPDALRTEQVSLSAIYSEEGRTVIGYSASNYVAVTVGNLARAGQLVDIAVKAGANHVYGPSLERGDRDSLYRKALEAALADAREKAETLAAGSGLTLGRPTVVQEAGHEPPMPYAEARAATAADVPIEPGTQEIEASVTVTFAAT